MATVCLQGGNEFSPECRAMDALLLDRIGAGTVVVVPLAGAPGREHDTAGANAARHFTALGAVDVRVAADARADAAAARAEVAAARLIVLPGGSPRRLRDSLVASGLDDVVRERVAGGVAVMGASAGAMVLCATTLIPEGRLTTGPGLGVITDFTVVPHWSGSRPAWVEALRAAAPDADVLGIPECSGVLIDGDAVTALGAQPSLLITADAELTLALDVAPPPG